MFLLGAILLAAAAVAFVYLYCGVALPGQDTLGMKGDGYNDGP